MRRGRRKRKEEGGVKETGRRGNEKETKQQKGGYGKLVKEGMRREEK